VTWGHRAELKLRRYWRWRWGIGRSWSSAATGGGVAASGGA